MKYVKMFIAGLAFPSTLLPFVLGFALLNEKPQILTIPFLHFIPVIWGIWNIVYFIVFRDSLKKNWAAKHLVWGAVLGLIISVIGVFWLNIPMKLDLPESLSYLPLILGPVFYGLAWRFIVKPLNELLEVQANTFSLKF